MITYRHNFKHTLYEEDIWNLDPKNLKYFDVLTAGFPCHPFSVAGYRKGFEDKEVIIFPHLKIYGTL